MKRVIRLILFIVFAAVVFVAGFFLGAAAGVALEQGRVNVVGGDTSPYGGEQQAQVTEGWHEFVPQYRPAWGNG